MKKKKHILLKVLVVLLVLGMARGVTGRSGTRGNSSARTTQSVTKTASVPETKKTQAAEPSTVKAAVTDAVVSKDFKAAMDAYEAFFDEYCNFMKRYAENPTDMNLLLQYTNYLAKYTEYMEAFDKMGNEPMNDAEMAYYLEVTLRIEKKLLDAEGSLLKTMK